MDNSPATMFTLFAFFFTSILLLGLVKQASGNVCEMTERPSKTWQGQCYMETSCDRKCQKWEEADHGTCHGGLNRRCVCYYKNESCGGGGGVSSGIDHGAAASGSSTGTVQPSAVMIPAQRGRNNPTTQAAPATVNPAAASIAEEDLSLDISNVN